MIRPPFRGLMASADAGRGSASSRGWTSWIRIPPPARSGWKSALEPVLAPGAPREIAGAAASLAFLWVVRRSSAPVRRSFGTGHHESILVTFHSTTRGMTKQLYVGNLSFETTEATLRATFERDGRTVTKVAIVTDHQRGRSRGFAFVEMEDEEQASAAIAAHDGTEIDGRTIKVDQGKERPEYRPKSESHGFQGGDSRGRGGRGRR